MKTQRTFVQDLKPGQRFFIGNQSLDLFEGIEKPGRYAVREVHAVEDAESLGYTPGEFCAVWAHDHAFSTGFVPYLYGEQVDVIVDNAGDLDSATRQAIESHEVLETLMHSESSTSRSMVTVRMLEQARAYAFWLLRRRQAVLKDTRRRRLERRAA
tara:strand:- start:198 stop:665 length:468 start_codon:yes stop_codon:yes gene_type:complete